MTTSEIRRAIAGSNQDKSRVLLHVPARVASGGPHVVGGGPHAWRAASQAASRAHLRRSHAPHAKRSPHAAHITDARATRTEAHAQCTVALGEMRRALRTRRGSRRDSGSRDDAKTVGREEMNASHACLSSARDEVSPPLGENACAQRKWPCALRDRSASRGEMFAAPRQSTGLHDVRRGAYAEMTMAQRVTSALHAERAIQPSCPRRATPWPRRATPRSARAQAMPTGPLGGARCAR